jgi:Fe2+ or Zn2+ uptake regulation protein
MMDLKENKKRIEITSVRLTPLEKRVLNILSLQRGNNQSDTLRDLIIEEGTKAGILQPMKIIGPSGNY